MNNHPLDDNFDPNVEHEFWGLTATICVCLRMKSHPIHGVWKAKLKSDKPNKPEPVLIK